MYSTLESAVIELAGVDGSRWILHGPGAGAQGVAMGIAPSGIYDSPRETQWSSGAYQIGATPLGTTRPARDVVFTAHCAGSTPAEIEAVEARWRRAWSYESDAVMTVTTAGSGSRHLRLRMMQEPLTDVEIDPHVTGYSAQVMTLRAPQPDYTGDPRTSTFVFDGVNWAGHVTVANDGDLPMWLEWSLTSPAAWILPDHSWQSDPDAPFYGFRERMVALPFQRWHHDPDRRQDVRIVTNRDGFQGRAVDEHQFLARWNGQRFMFPVPPHTPPTKLPVAVNPLPWLPDLWRRLKLPHIPAGVLYHIAKGLTGVLSPIGAGTVLSWTADDIVSRIDGVIDALTIDELEPIRDTIRKALGLPTAGELITSAWGSVSQLPGAAARVYCTPLHSRPWGSLQ